MKTIAYKISYFLDTLLNTLVKNVALDTFQGIYAIPCKNQPKLYISKNGRAFEKRLNEHKYDIKYARESNACFIHLRNEGHQLNWKDTKLIHKLVNSFERKMLGYLSDKCGISK